MTHRRFKLIYNPSAGIGRERTPFLSQIKRYQTLKKRSKSYSILSIIQDVFAAHNIDVDTHIIEKNDDAGDIAAACSANDYDAIVVAGGDGTINRVIQGLVNSEIPLGIIPVGSINILAMELGIPFDVAEACKYIIKGKSRFMDLGQMNGRYFACMVGVGLDAKIIKHTTADLKKYLGLLSFAVVACKKLLFHSFRPIHCLIDHQKEVHRGYAMIISNSKYYAGNYVLSEKAVIEDGKLDIILLKDRGKRNFIRFVWHLAMGTLEFFDGIEQLQATHIEVCDESTHHIHVDAEYIGKHRAVISVLPQALTVLC
ncbi:diacylglycerol kinase family lipid kinase [bacterium]|nr:diacylglycerol kinase family lipid kinase [bacterium]